MNSPFEAIYRACLEIALDNGGINRARSKAQQGRDFERWIATQPEEMLPPIEAWLASLTDEQLFEVCCGGEGEPEKAALMEGAPAFADDLLNSYFDECC